MVKLRCRPGVTHKLRFRDSSLLPLRGDPPADEELAGRTTSMPQPM